MMSTKLRTKALTALTAMMLGVSFLPLHVYAQEGQEPKESPEITENSPPADEETDAQTAPAEGKETIPEEPETIAPETRQTKNRKNRPAEMRKLLRWKRKKKVCHCWRHRKRRLFVRS